MPTDKSKHNDLLTVQMAVLPGHSGSGVFNAAGKLVGIITDQLGTSQALITPVVGLPDAPAPLRAQKTSRVDTVYKHGIINIRSRSTPQQIQRSLNLNRPLTWDTLRVAPEFREDIVKFKNLDASNVMPDWGCFSPVDDVVPFFDNNELLRVSLRFWYTSDCTEPEMWLSYFADTVDSKIDDLEDGRFFHAQGSSTHIMGWSDPNLTIVEIGRVGFASIAPDEWIEFIAENLSAPPR